MADYDSDSSVEYTETKVLLGYISKGATDTDDTISRLGGRPEWIDPTEPPSAALARCRVCKDFMVLLLQLNGELPDNFPGHERRLYVFSCRKPACRRKDGSVRAIRGVRLSEDAAMAVPAAPTGGESTATPKEAEEAGIRGGAGLGETLFGATSLVSASSANPFSGANPFSSPTASSEPNPFSNPPPAKTLEPKDGAAALPKTFAETLSLNSPSKSTKPQPPEPWPEVPAQPRAYPTLYLVDVDYETLDPTPLKVPANARMEAEDPAGGSGKDEKELFESSMDAVFQKFADRMAQNPEQVIRYEFGGQPLLYSKGDAVGSVLGSGKSMPRCGGCGAGRVFELQLTPHAITELEAEEMTLEGMDWGTIIVGVCERDCQAHGVETGHVGYIEEWAGVQWEELTK